MFGYEKIKLNLAYDSVYFIIAIIILAAYTFYIYRYTLPPVSRIKKFILTSLRTLALLCLLFIFFEPVLSFTKKFILKPVNLIFIDNSLSMTIDDGTKRVEKVKSIVDDYKNARLNGEKEFYLFGSKIRKVTADSLEAISFNDGITNFSDIFKTLKKGDKNYSTISVISDGVITAGSNPVYEANKIDIPVFAIGVGDTTHKTDVKINRVLYNNILYEETPTEIIVTLQNEGLINEKAQLSLYENNVLIEQKPIVLSQSGIQNESFTYSPNSSGEKKLTVVISNVKNDYVKANNRKIFYVKVLSNKINVVILAGTPSSDLSFIKTVLKNDKNLTVKSITQISKDKFLEGSLFSAVDSANIFFMIGFPSRNTPGNLISKVKKRISDKNIPFFFVFSNGIDLTKLKKLNKELPFTIKNSFGGIRKVQPQVYAEQKDNPIIQFDSENILKNWNNLPPVFQASYNFDAKPGAEIISNIKVNNIVLNEPLILSRAFGGKRAIAVLAGEIWRWKLQTALKGINLFDRFISNSVRWLNTPAEERKFNVKTSRKIYSVGENIQFSAQVYDESLNPVSNADVKLNIRSGDKKIQLDLQPLGNGLYEGSVQINKKGDYRFTGSATSDGKVLGKSSGTFNVGDLDIEMVNPRMDYEFLTLLAKETNGKFFDANNYKNIFPGINSVNEKSVREQLVTSEVDLWSNNWLMIIAILLFSLEWFLRKRAGML